MLTRRVAGDERLLVIASSVRFMGSSEFLLLAVVFSLGWSGLFRQPVGDFKVDFALLTAASLGEVHLDSLSPKTGTTSLNAMLKGLGIEKGEF
ncbi:MAG: hypothetical protein OXN97_14470 [Bryobacterales bacterium]|nr:hypothetical protein [Bryobacterales bacterium]